MNFGNIGKRQRGIRLIGGIILFLIGLILTFYLILSGQNRTLRFIVFIPFSGAFLCFLEVKQKICVGLSACGLQNMDSDQEKIKDPAIIKELRKDSIWLIMKAVLFGTVATVLCLLI